MKSTKNEFWRSGCAALPKLGAWFVIVLITTNLFTVTAHRETIGQAAIAGLAAQPGALEAGVMPAGSYVPQSIYCASDDGRRHYCDADTRGGVRLVNQRSGSPCTYGRSWGYDRRGIWVDRG
ncbi:MAG TPA: DUF3011 domain-containing protein, partial [Blastocatellia bacterium]|nr:DUF3011 domain-containing protein [Blastocatellia bacterium]